MSSYSSNKIDSIRVAFNEAKVLLEENQINMLEYRSLVNSLFNEVKELDKNYKNEFIGEFLNTLINKENK